MLLIKRFTFSICCLSLFMLASLPLQASIVSADDPVFGIGSITRDTDTGLEWLDLHHSSGRTLADVVLQFGQGGDFEGFRYASLLEVDTLFQHFGLELTDGVERVEYFPLANTLFSFLGTTSTAPGVGEVAFGVTNTPGPIGNFRIAMVQTTIFNFPEKGLAIASDAFPSTFRADQVSSHWLVREAAVVPLPPALLMFTSALLVLRLGFPRNTSN